MDLNLSDREIPKIIHLCYKTKNIPDFILKNWKELNPDYEIILYDNNDCIRFLLDNFGQNYVNIFNFIRDGPIKADFFRVCVLYKCGGVYSDIDCQLLIPIKNFIEQNITFLTCISNNINELNPHLIISPKNHPILKAAIDKYNEIYIKSIPYSYWGWSIVQIMICIFKNIFAQYINSEGIYYDRNNNKYQLIKEIFQSNDAYSHYCTYKNMRILNNRYSLYNPHKHEFI